MEKQSNLLWQEGKEGILVYESRVCYGLLCCVSVEEEPTQQEFVEEDGRLVVVAGLEAEEFEGWIVMLVKVPHQGREIDMLMENHEQRQPPGISSHQRQHDER